MRKTFLARGESAPWFTIRSPHNPHFAFDSVAGRYVVLCFFGSAADSASRRALELLAQHQQRFDVRNAAFFGVSVDPEDEKRGRVKEHLPGMQLFWDFDRSVSALYGAATPEGGYRKVTYLLDERLRVLALFPLADKPEEHVSAVLALLAKVPPLGSTRLAGKQAPVLIVPRVFEPKFCRHLIEHYEAHGGGDSGFMRDEGGKTVGIIDYSHKRRRDHFIKDEDLIRACNARIQRRLGPEVHKAFQFRATHIERHVIACYDAAEKAHFRPHRDNTSLGTAHRRFAVSLYLNTGEFAGGHLRFPEYGPAIYQAPVGAAVVFSCSMLHEAMPVTQGKRYMFLPFLYDAQAASVRRQNSKFLAGRKRAESKA